MAAAEIISGRITNQAALAPLVMATGDSLAVRSFNDPDTAYLLQAWALGATAGELRIRSPRMHDNVNNIRQGVLAATAHPLYPGPVRQKLYSQDLLIAEMSGGGAETDAASFLMYYTRAGGLDARLYRLNEIQARIQDYMTLTVAVTSGVTLGDYVGSTLLSAATGSFEANTDYALLGYVSSAQVASVGVRGQDTGNLRIGGPGPTTRIETRDWFVDQSDANDLPLIPVINSANAGGTTLDVVQTAANTNPSVALFFAQLAT